MTSERPLPRHVKRSLSDSPPPSSQPPPLSYKAESTTREKEQAHIKARTEKPVQSTRQPFDPWNSSSTGHQRAENRLAGSTSWRDSRSAKLTAQFAGGAGGGARVADTVGAGSKDFGKDGRELNDGWVRGTSGSRERGQLAIWEAMNGGSKRRKVDRSGERTSTSKGEVAAAQGDGASVTAKDQVKRTGTGDTNGMPQNPHEDADQDPYADDEPPPPPQKRIFRNLCFYINGSTAPTVSDHKLKRLLAAHGATTSIALGRRSVTHVILGRSGEGGAGGGLAGGKLHREITRVGGKSIKYVGVEWVMESLKAGRRLPEAGFTILKIAPKGQRSVFEMFKVGDGDS